jgi:hypothetical protein
MNAGKKTVFLFGLITGLYGMLPSVAEAQVVEKVKENTVEKLEERAVEKSEEISDAILDKIEGLFKKKKKVEEAEVPEKKVETEEPRTVKKNKFTKSS